MLYVIIRRSKSNLSRVATGKILSAKVAQGAYPGVETRNDWKTFDDAKEVAAALGSEYIATDAGSNVSPRYDVQKLPKIGEKVSYAFNGDSYPCGTIIAISKSLKVITTKDGENVKKFYRVRETGCWRNNRTWSLVSGHVYKQNPSF